MLVVVLVLRLLLMRHGVMRTCRRGGRRCHRRRRRLRCERVLLGLWQRLTRLHFWPRRGCCREALVAALSPALGGILNLGMGVALNRVSFLVGTFGFAAE